jgi:hypothetical protein
LLVALPTAWDLSLRAKYLFVAAISVAINGYAAARLNFFDCAAHARQAWF